MARAFSDTPQRPLDRMGCAIDDAVNTQEKDRKYIAQVERRALQLELSDYLQQANLRRKSPNSS
jgi:hypothetical protein